MAPGLSRARFGFERWASHDDTERAGMQGLREQARQGVLPKGAPVHASDVDPKAVERARGNAREAGVDLLLERCDIRDVRPLDPPGWVVTNPPYGERLDASFSLYEELARSLRRMKGHTVAVLAGTPAIGRAMRREPDRWWILYNGPIECRLLVYSIA
jgi:23S rRNA G2445 N2-methylase RlmL